MKLLISAVICYTCVLAYENSEEFITEINSKQSLWKAGRNFHKDTPMSAIRNLLGLRKLPEHIRKTIPIVEHKVNINAIPETFDMRTNWPDCASMKIVLDQSACSSDYIVSVASAISDRICVHSQGANQPKISAIDEISCDINQRGCKGGDYYTAWWSWEANGLVTGGSYGSNIGCKPYPFAPCEHNVDGPKPACPSEVYTAPKCVRKCHDNSSIVYEDDLYYGSQVYMLSPSDYMVQAEIMKYGPVVTGMDVYADFIHYKSGVYYNTTTIRQGAHAVKIIGWGIENGVKYWLVMNSWNEDWGDKGLFKIRRGVNECGIEDRITAGIPK